MSALTGRPRLRASLVVARRVGIVVALILLLLGVGNRPAPAESRAPEIDVLIAVDRTTSMSALDDPSGSRITAVRRDLVRLGASLDSVRFALMTFGKTATLVLPWTTDRVAFDSDASALQTEKPTDGTGSSLDRAVPMMLDQLQQADDDDAAAGTTAADVERIPVVVLVSDGENTAPENTKNFARVGRLARGAVVLGYGTQAGGMMPLNRVDPGATPPAPDQAGPFVPDPATGQPAYSRLDPTTLQGVATRLGGTYVQMNGAQSISDVAARIRADAYADREPVPPQREIRWVWALVLLLLTLGELRQGWRQWLDARREARAGRGGRAGTAGVAGAREVTT